MLRLIKRISWLGLMAGGLQGAWGFSLLGPVNEAYQVSVIGYNLAEDIGAPKNIGQEYRRNTPVMYYTCDANFWDFFGARGVEEIDKAFGVFNALPPVSKMSADLSEFPLVARRANYRAEALSLIDLKSFTMTMIIEQLGLAQPDRYIWTIHDRWLQPNTTCPLGELYLIIKRNFDPVIGTSYDQLKPTSYLNGTLYAYEIIELCTAPVPPIAWAQAVPVDANAELYTPLASGYGYNQVFTFSPFGAFFTGLTRDDAGGLRYLLRTNNMNVESSGPGTVTFVTNTIPTLLTTSNLTLLTAQSITNAAGALTAIYPNLQILTTSNYFVNVDVTNTVFYFTNFPWDPVRTPAHLVGATNVTQTVAERYVHTFGNILEVLPTTNGWMAASLPGVPPTNGQAWITIETVSIAVSNNPWAPYGTNAFTTNTSLVTYQTNTVVGDYVILPTNMCEFAIINSQLTNVVAITNVIFTLTNTIVTTNASGGITPGTVLGYTQSMVTYFTNHTFVIFPVNCEQTNVALRQGVEKISFVRRDYDSLLSRFFTPITNEYVLTAVTNGTLVPNKVQRVVTVPDILLTAQDLTAGPDARPYSPVLRRNINYNVGNVYPGLAGPGTIEPATVFTYNNVGPLYENFGMLNTNIFLFEQDQFLYFIWGSFDGTTNVPAIYPNDRSIVDMENQVLIQITPQYLPLGNVGRAYSGQLRAQSATAAWQQVQGWSIAPGSLPLPAGLHIMKAGDGSGLIYGTPQRVGTSDFVIRVTFVDPADSTRVFNVDRSYAIRVDP